MQRLLLFWVVAAVSIEQVSAQMLNNIASFTGANGSNPVAALIQGTDGNFYGTTTNGGASGFGTVFKLTTNGSLSALISFTSNNGARPMCGVIQGTNGDLFGTTRDGGAHGLGTIFELTLNGTLTTLYSFSGTDGSHPYGGLVQGNDGNFYGTTFDGGAVNLGTIFRITPGGVLTKIADFNQTNGANPVASLMQAADGSFYGATPAGGNFVTNGITFLYGTVFRLSGNTITTLNSFGPDAALPYGGVVQGNDGNLYGTTVGPANAAVYEIGSNNVTSVALSTNGDQAYGAVIQASDGNFYGTTRQTIFQLTANGNVSTVTSIDGLSYAGLLQASDGNFYGTTAFGGSQGVGSVFQLIPRPQITAQPTSQTVFTNAPVFLTASATGVAPIAYQWRKNGANVPGANGVSLMLPNAQQTDSGTYTLLVTNGFGAITSAVAVVSVLSPTAFQKTTRNPDGSLAFTWGTDSGTSYNVQYKSNLTDLQWSTTGATVASNSLGVTISPGTNAQGFYRIVSSYSVSDPVGFVQVALPGNSDSYVSIPFLRPAAGFAVVSSVAGNVITAAQQTPSAWAVNEFVYSTGSQSNTYYVRFVSGAGEGRTCTISANDTNSLTISATSDLLAAIRPGDALIIEPYWTLNSVFPNGAGVNVSPSQGNRNTEVLIPDFTSSGINLSSSKTYYFNAGLWKQFGLGNVDHGDDILQLNAPLIVRHNVATNTTLVTVGVVPMAHWSAPLRTPDGSAGNKQDNYLALARPVAVTLDGSGLIASGAFAASPLPGSRTDELLTFDNTAIAKNKSSSAIYFYWSNAWRRVGSGTATLGSAQVFTPATGVIIRKGTNIASPIWTNAPTY